MMKALYLSEDLSVISDGLDELSIALLSSAMVTVELANKIYVGRRCSIKEAYQLVVENYQGGECERIDFRSTENAQLMINNWVAQKTKNKIKDLIEDDTLSRNTTLLLVNAIYFSGSWRQKMARTYSPEEYFFIGISDKVRLPMITHKDVFPYAEIKKIRAKVAQIFFKERFTSMLIILPNEVDGLEKVVKKLKKHSLEDINESLKSTVLSLSVPVLSFERTTRWEGALAQIGLTSMFSDGNFSGLCEAAKGIDRITHKTFITIDEKGAGAVGGGNGETRRNAKICGKYATCRKYPWRMRKASRSGPYTPPTGEFRVNRPFLFLIQEHETRTVLFMGTVWNPLKNNTTSESQVFNVN